MLTKYFPSDILRRTVTLTAILGAGAVMMHAQAPTTTSATAAAAETRPTLNLDIQSNLNAAADQGYSSSSSDLDSTGTQVASIGDAFRLPEAMQYQSRRYGRPRYRGGNTNQDGSSKWAFAAGAGFTQPVGNTYHYLTPSWGFQVGAGRNFSKYFTTMVEVDYDRFGFNGRTISGQSYLYFGDATNPYGLDGNTHIWSVGLSPVVNFYSGQGLGAYVVGGVGFYHKVADFTLPETESGCDIYYCYSYTGNAVVDHYSSNAPGFNAGIGFTYKMSRFSSERLYGEARYVIILNSQRYGVTPSNLSASNVNDANYFPANSNRTSYFPVKFGIRF